MVKTLFSYIETKNRKKTLKTIQGVNSAWLKYYLFSDEELKDYFSLFKQKTVFDEQDRVNIFACIKEAIRRVLQIELHDVQLLAGFTLADGKVAEMATGEGKTVMSVLPACWYTLLGRKVHIMTVNEYLAKRDFEEMGKVFQFLGFTVGINLSNMTVQQKKQAYEQDITYGVCSEFGFDYLRDHLVIRQEAVVQSDLHVALIDEIDSILIDEAKTPLIISEKHKSPPDTYAVCARLISKMVEGKDYELDLKTNQVIFTERAIHRLESLLMIENLYDVAHAQLFHFLLQSLCAHVFMKKDEHYIIKDSEIKIIDSFTGRILDGKQYNDGLHQAIEAKEGVPLSEENRIKATITIQKLFSLYKTIIGMSGTIKTDEKELYELYGIEVEEIPTSKPVIREDLDDLIFATKKEKYEAVVHEIKESFKRGQPVLVGTTSVAQSDHVAQLLKNEGIPFQLLNAKTESEEAMMIAKAGQIGMITIATNMAGRGTDIRLGEGVAELGGLYVIGTEKHESRRIDHQLRGRAGRQGDPGKSRFFLSLEDDLIVRFAGDRKQKGKEKALFEKVQYEVEQQNYAMRTITYLLDSVIHDQRNLFYNHRKKLLKGEHFLEVVENHVVTYMKTEINRRDKDDVSLTELVEQAKKLVQASLAEMSLLQKQQFFRQYMALIDEQWADHLHAIHHLKQSLHSRIYEQRDPILIFHDEAWKLYQSMEQQIRDKLFNLFTHKLKEGKQDANVLESPSHKAI